MTQSELTSRQHWVDYWASRADSLVRVVPENQKFADVLAAYLPRGAALESLEIGGFPGYFSVFFGKYYGYRATLLDFYIDDDIVMELSKTNRLDTIINTIEGDFLGAPIPAKYDVVVSFGFIEHFENIPDVVKRHVDYLRDDGYLIIGVPNFLGLNGLIQRIFDSHNYSIHNIAAMDPANLRNILESQQIGVLEARYYGVFGIWLDASKNNRLLSFLFRGINYIGRHLLRSPSRWFSPFTVVVARKRAESLPS